MKAPQNDFNTMKSTPQNDNALFDRLADGELTPEERRELLASLDGRPDGWRQCALALLEAQVWREQLKSYVRTEAPPTTVQVEAATPSQLPARSVRVWALAASTLIAFALGWSLQPQNKVAPSPNELASNEVPVVEQLQPEVNAPVKRLTDSSDAVTLVVRDVEGRNQRVSLPLVDAETLGGQWAQASSSVPAELRAGLQNRGLDLRSKRRYAPLFFEQDQGLVPMVVPVDDTYVVPVNRPVY